MLSNSAPPFREVYFVRAGAANRQLRFMSSPCNVHRVFPATTPSGFAICTQHSAPPARAPAQIDLRPFALPARVTPPIHDTKLPASRGNLPNLRRFGNPG